MYGYLYFAHLVCLLFSLVPVLFPLSIFSVWVGWSRKKGSACVRPHLLFFYLHRCCFCPRMGCNHSRISALHTSYDLRMRRRDVLGTHPGRPSFFGCVSMTHPLIIIFIPPLMRDTFLVYPSILSRTIHEPFIDPPSHPTSIPRLIAYTHHLPLLVILRGVHRRYYFLSFLSRSGHFTSTRSSPVHMVFLEVNRISWHFISSGIMSLAKRQ